MNLRFAVIVAAAALLSACASAPKPLQGSFNQVNPRDSVGAPQVGAPGRGGGRIISTTPGQNATCFQLVSRPLGGNGRPLSSAPDATDGRFIACRAGFYDPAVFAEGREVTFVGKIEAYESTRIGDYDYQLPRVAADVVYLWPEVREVDVVRPYPYYDPFRGPRWGHGGHWGWW